MYFPHLRRALTTAVCSTNLWLNSSSGHCRAYQQMRSWNLQKKETALVEKSSSYYTNPIAKPSLGFSFHIASRTFLSIGPSKPRKLQRPETVFDRVSEFSGDVVSFHDFLEAETDRFYGELKALNVSGNKTGEIDLLRANYEAAKEKMSLRPLTFREVNFVFVITYGFMEAGDSEFVCGPLLEMKNLVQGQLKEILHGSKGSGDFRLLFIAHLGLGYLYMNLKKFEESENVCRSLVSRIGYLPEPSRILLVEPYLGIARALIPTGKETEAIEYYRRVIVILESCVGTEDKQFFKPLFELASLLCKQGKYKEAETEFLRLLKLETKFGKSDEARMSNFRPAYVNRDTWEMNEAIGWCKKALNDTSRGDTTVENIRMFLADLLGDSGRESECREMLKEWLVIAEKNEGKESMRSAKYMVKLGRSHLQSFNYSEAENFLRKSLEIMAKIASPDDPNLTDAMMLLAFALSNLGRCEEAEKLVLEARGVNKEAFEESSLQGRRS